MAVMSANELVNKVKSIATNYKTLYIYGCFGSPMNAANKKRYTNNYDYNKQPSRKNKILNASSDTFGFDCVCLIKGVLWGWNGNVNATYGGAVYCSNGVPDTNANGMFQNYCTNKTSNFSNIVPGEFVWMDGHIGVYIGDGLVVECTPIWKDGVQITACGNIGKKAGYNTRTWTQHGKSKFIDYNTPTPTPTPTLKYKVGDKVVLNGQLYGSAYGEHPGKVVNDVITNIIRVVPNAPYPYNTTGDLGWMAESSIKPYEEPSFLPSRGYFQPGDSGDNVEKIDEFFANQVSGKYYGDYTTACVKVFQKQNGLEEDGCIGPITLAKMKEQGFKE